MTAAALYLGRVTHRRTRPRPHFLAYGVYMLLLDLDRLDADLDGLKVLRRGRRGLMSFDPRDHGDGSDTPLRAQVEARLAEAGLAPPGGAIRLLTMPRVLGHGFNPISVYFCHRPDGPLAAVLYEVTNTFGERHSYAAATPDDGGAAHAHGAPKRFHVSPFMDMELAYDFRLTDPGERLALTIVARDPSGPLLTATFAGERRPLDDRQLLSAWLTHPLLTLKVVGGIHWEALKIWLKGVGYRRRPAAPAQAVTRGLPHIARRNSAQGC